MFTPYLTPSSTTSTPGTLDKSPVRHVITQKEISITPGQMTYGYISKILIPSLLLPFSRYFYVFISIFAEVWRLRRTSSLT